MKKSSKNKENEKLSANELPEEDLKKASGGNGSENTKKYETGSYDCTMGYIAPDLGGAKHEKK